MKFTVQKGFTLIELLVSICIIAVIASIIVLLLNPQELIQQGRDSIRIQDLSNLEKGINYALQENPENVPEVLCYQLTPPCMGTSLESSSSARAIDGTGWVKINLASGLSTSILPLDPINLGIYFYNYSTNNAGTKWELNAKLESNKYQDIMQKDSGNNLTVLELGSDRTILP